MKSNLIRGNALGTFSLRNILQNHIDPHICQQILDEIKSPLMEQSFDLTNDNSRNISTSQIPRRPNIPPAPISPANPKFKDLSFSRSHQSFNLSIHKHLDKPNGRQRWRDAQYIESIVSPLHPRINQHNQVQTSKQSRSDWMCGAFDNAQEKQNQIQIEGPFKPWDSSKRKKIFKKLETPQYIIFHPKNNKPSPARPAARRRAERVGNQVRIEDAIEKLHSLKQTQMANFLALLSDLDIQLTNLQILNIRIQQLMPEILQTMAKQSSFIPNVDLLNETHQRILKRLRVKNTYQAIESLRASRESNQIGMAAQSSKIIEDYFCVLNRIEVIVSNYLKLPSSLQSLKTIYEFMSGSYPDQANLCDQIQKCLNVFSVYELDLRSVQRFTYIWKQGGVRLVSEEEFIQSLCQNDFIYSSLGDKFYENDLKEKGFERNF